MNHLGELNQQNIDDTIVVVKLLSLLFCFISFAGMIFRKVELTYSKTTDYYKVSVILPLFLMISILYILWFFLAERKNKIKRVKIIENFVFIIIYSITILLNGLYNSNLKLLFLFSIIISTIEINEQYGTLSAIISSIFILITDLICAPKSSINLYFQNDLIIIGVFILIVWILGHYVKLEREKMEQKNFQLEEINKELNEFSKQREYMEQLLLKVDSCYKMLVEDSNDAILVQHNGNVVIGNNSSLKLFGVESLDEVIDRSILDFIPVKDKDYVNTKLQNVYNGNSSFLSFEHELETASGSLTIVMNTSAFFIYEGKPTLLSRLHDITSEKQVERLQEDVKKSNGVLEETLELNKSITEFFSNVSHELKTPLNVIFSTIQLLNYYKENSVENFEEKQTKYMKIMKQNCYRLMRLINNLLDLTRFDSGFLNLRLGNYNIVAIVEDIVLSVATYVESRGIDITFDTNMEEKNMALDPDKIERIILNLLSNAVKFTESGGQIFINIISFDEKVLIHIKDTGIGIPENKLALIFGRFMQVDKSLRREREGSGIGLSLVKSFVDMHHGKINVNSKLGYGSEFIIELPVNLLEGEIVDKKDIYEHNIERISIEFSDIYS